MQMDRRGCCHLTIIVGRLSSSGFSFRSTLLQCNGVSVIGCRCRLGYRLSLPFSLPTVSVIGYRCRSAYRLLLSASYFFSDIPAIVAWCVIVSFVVAVVASVAGIATSVIFGYRRLAFIILHGGEFCLFWDSCPFMVGNFASSGIPVPAIHSCDLMTDLIV
jgi:hypothetical protein